MTVIPVGAIANSAALAVGGLIGAAIGGKLSSSAKSMLTSVMGLCALAIAIVNIAKLSSLPAVVLSVILGVIAGELLDLDRLVKNAVTKIMGRSQANEEWLTQFCVIITLFAVSGTGVFGILKEGFEGDSSILIAKAVLDFFTAIVFATTLGKAVSAISVPQFSIYLALFFLARLLYPLISQTQILNFSAIGGMVDLGVGFTMLGVKKFKTINFLPAFVFVFPATLLFELAFGK
ncbi:MAG: DUF554 family protein [Clostridiales bacterium]|jgi:uncharacterized membrane protein YqgA involved in biofilm formation|nr:DUF554 family protein [Clostridiales bacterium]MDR2750387.1 DUF554 family protein [Clostridiales bacterium]